MNQTTSRFFLFVSAAFAPALFTGCETTQGVRNPSGVPVTEMRADDLAARHVRDRSLVASALLALSAAVPRGALAVGGGACTQQRFERLVSPQRLPWHSRVAAWTLSASALGLPVVLALSGFAPVAWLHFCPLPA